MQFAGYRGARWLLSCLLITMLCSCRAPSVARQHDRAGQDLVGTSDSAQESVFLIHGLGRTHLSLGRLGRHLERNGYSVIRWSYSSFSLGIDEIGRQLAESLAEVGGRSDVSRIHLVGHSLGGIVARRALLYGLPSKLGRVVQLASPNRGAPRARFWEPIAGGFITPLDELTDDPGSVVNRMALPHGFEIGIIAGETDTVVPAEYARLQGAAYTTVPSGHTFIMNNDRTLEQVVEFLRHGRFLEGERQSTGK